MSNGRAQSKVVSGDESVHVLCRAVPAIVDQICKARNLIGVVHMAAGTLESPTDFELQCVLDVAMNLLMDAEANLTAIGRNSIASEEQ